MKLLLLIGLALGCLICPAHTTWAQAPAPSGTVITIAGNGVGGFSGDGGPATAASISGSYGPAIGPDGTLYVSDANNYRIRAIDPVTGIITTIAGNGANGNTGNGGPATDAALSGVLAIAVDRARNALYIGDVENNWVRKVDLTTGLLTVYAGTGIFGSGFSGDGGPATSAEFGFVEGVATDGAGRLSIVDIFNSRVRQVDPITGIITTIAGNGNSFTAGDGGPATAASFETPTSLAADSAGNVFVNDNSASSRVRRIDAVTGIITTVAGGGTNPPGAGPATDVNLAGINNYIAVDDAGTLFLAHGNQVFKVDLTTGQLSPFAGAASGGFSGDGGPALDARFETITGLTLAPGGGLIVSDHFNQRIRYVVPDSINLVADSQQTEFYLPWVSALSGEIIITNNPNLSVIDMGSLVSIGGSINVSENASAGVIDMSSLVTSSGSINVSENASAGVIDMSSLVTSSGSINVSENASAGVIDMSSLVTSSGSIDVSGNTSAGVIDLPALESVGGDISIKDNTSAMAVDMSSLVSTSGSIEITENTSATVIDVSSLVSTSGTIEITGNDSAAIIDLGSLASAGGSVRVRRNSSATVIDLAFLTSAGGSIDASGNTAAGSIDLGSLASAGGSVDVSGNTAAGSIDLGSLASVGGNVDASGNTAAGSIDLGSLASAGGSVDVSDNDAAGSIDLDSLASVGGSIDVSGNEAAGSIDLGSLASVGGSVDVSGNEAAGVSTSALSRQPAGT